MFNPEKEWITKFLTRAYPIRRIKFKNGFKSTIIDENGDKYFVSDRKSREDLYLVLFNSVQKVFDADPDLVKTTLIDFLNLKRPS